MFPESAFGFFYIILNVKRVTPAPYEIDTTVVLTIETGSTVLLMISERCWCLGGWRRWTTAL